MGPAARDISGVESLDDVLAGHLGAEAVRRVVLKPRDFGLAPLLDHCLPHGRHWSLRPVDSKYKPGRRLTVYYTATSDADLDARHVAVTWSCSGAQPPLTGSPAASAERVTVMVHPDDPSMPALARLSDGAYLATLAASLRGVRGGSPRPLLVRVVRYRPGQRHVLRAVPDDGGTGLVVKTDQEDASSRAVRLARLVGPVLEQRWRGLGLVRPVGYSTGDRAALWQESAGEPLRRVLTARADPFAVMEHVGRGLRMLHDIDLGRLRAGNDGAALPRCRDADEQLAITARAGEHIAALLPDVGATYRNLTWLVRQCLDGLPRGPTSVTHGDVKCEHLLVERNGLLLLDLDRAGRGDPALDLGNVLADLRWWYDDADGDALFRALRGGYGPCDPARWARAAVLAVLAQLRQVARRCPVHDPAWESQVRTRVAAAAAALRAERVP